MNNPNPTGGYVKETISVLKFPEVQGPLQFARKVALDQVAYENEARGVKSLKIQAVCQCKKRYNRRRTCEKSKSYRHECL